MPNSQGQPPADFLQACDPGDNESEVWIPLEATITLQAALPTPVGFDATEPSIITPDFVNNGYGSYLLVGGSQPLQVDGMQVNSPITPEDPNGGWTSCSSENNGYWQWTLNPGVAYTLQAWGAVPMLSNDEPSFSTADAATWAFAAHADTFDESAPSQSPELVSYSGPNAAACPDETNSGAPDKLDVLFLYSKPPVSFQGQVGAVKCTTARSGFLLPVLG
jgi:hypothetical protein